MAFRDWWNRWRQAVTGRLTEGQGLVEYALILVLVAVVVIAVLAILGPAIAEVYDNVLAQF